MTRLLMLCVLLAASAAPLTAHAMTEQPVPSAPGTHAQYADPDEREEQFSDAPRSAGVPSGREQSLLGSQNSGSQQTYGFNGYQGASRYDLGSYGRGTSFGGR